jgi:NAD(P)-dependent dehydrogenase (short-subunit alcohol dehydrogenase family)
MRKLAGQTAFVTGGASGIGLALGQAFAEAGMKVMLADIETDPLAAAVTQLRNLSPDVHDMRARIIELTRSGLDRRMSPRKSFRP